MTPASSQPVVLAIQNDATTPAALVGEWLAEDGLAVRVIGACFGEPVPAEIPEGVHALLPLGGSMGANDDHVAPWLPDERALIAYGRQMKTGAPIRLFGTSNTGKLVRVTATDPEERARLLQQNDLGGGRYVLSEDGKSLLSPTSYMRRLQTEGYMSSGVDVAQANGVTYLKSGGQALKYDGGKFVPLAEGEAAPTDWKPAMVYTEGDKGRYMTAADLDNPPAVADIGFVTAEDKKAIAYRKIEKIAKEQRRKKR